MTSRAFGAGVWTVGTRLIAKVIDLGMLLCLARFLGPAEFGLVAMAMAAVLIVEALFELPMAAALIRATELTPGMLNTAFTLSLLRGGIIASLLLAVSWPLAAFNDEPRLRALLAVLALAPAMRGLVNPRMVEYARVLDFRPDALTELSGKAVAFFLSVLIAATTGSYWAIAAATVGGPLTTTLVSFFIAPLRPRLTLAYWWYFSDLVGWNFLSQAGSALNWQIDRLILPRLTTTAAFGQYAMGKQISEILIQALTQPLFRPAMTALVSADVGRRSRYMRLSRAIVLVMVPVMGVPLLWPEVLIRVALGPSWWPAATWLRWTSAVAMMSLPAVLMGPLAMTLDRTRWLAVRTLVELIVRLPLVWWGAVRFGIPGAIFASAIATAFGTLTAMFFIRRLLDVDIVEQAMTFGRPMLAMLPAGAILYGSEPMIMKAGSLPEMLLWAVPLGVTYFLLYAFFLFLAWWLAGCPAGLEQHLFDSVRARVHRTGAFRSKIPSNRPITSKEINSDLVEPTAPLHLVINGKFLQPSSSHSGVYRVAKELLVALDKVLVDNEPLAMALRCRVLVPGNHNIGLHLSRIRVENDEIKHNMSPLVRRLIGVLWEQIVLPRRVKGQTLVSLCNIGPILHRNAFTMVHDAQVYTSPQSYSRAFRTWYRFVLPLLGRWNRGLLTVSHYSKKQLDAFGVAAARNISVIHNGCDHVLRFVPDPTAVESAGLAGTPYVMALANRQRHKNIQVLLEAFHSPALQGITLGLFGPATREDFEAQGCLVPPNVKFLGFVSDQQLAGLLQRAVALAFPSTTEGFGLPPLEAMALGCPTVVAPCGALPEVCGNAALWAEANDPKQWTRQIARLCQDEELHAEMRRQGQAHAAQFTWETAAYRLLESVLGYPLARSDKAKKVL